MNDIELPTPEQARTLTDRIKIAVEGTWQLIREAYTSRTWAVLGYDTWDAYCAAEFGETQLKLPKEERQEIVASLRDSGLTTRAISAATGLARNTVMKDLAQFEPAAEVLGVDGKRYPGSRPTVDSSIWVEPDQKIASPVAPIADGQHRLRQFTDEVVDAELVDEPAAPTPVRAPDRQPRVDPARTVLVALTELRQTRESLQALTAAHLAREDEETRRIWAARLNTELEALHGFHNALIKEI